ncbi:MAG TPA: hypothetical protein PKG68_08905, partial [Bacteroidales bacterium]|nr:hypothetical protein [Bacteroidales bacterium]
MKRRLIAVFMTLAAAASATLQAQDIPQALSLTVDQAVEYALDHNRSVSAARYDLLASEKSVWETMA